MANSKRFEIINQDIYTEKKGQLEQEIKDLEQRINEREVLLKTKSFTPIELVQTNFSNKLVDQAGDYYIFEKKGYLNQLFKGPNKIDGVYGAQAVKEVLDDMLLVTGEKEDFLIDKDSKLIAKAKEIQTGKDKFLLRNTEPEKLCEVISKDYKPLQRGEDLELLPNGVVINPWTQSAEKLNVLNKDIYIVSDLELTRDGKYIELKPKNIVAYDADGNKFDEQSTKDQKLALKIENGLHLHYFQRGNWESFDEQGAKLRFNGFKKYNKENPDQEEKSTNNFINQIFGMNHPRYKLEYDVEFSLIGKNKTMHGDKMMRINNGDIAIMDKKDSKYRLEGIADTNGEIYVPASTWRIEDVFDDGKYADFSYVYSADGETICKRDTGSKLEVLKDGTIFEQQIYYDKAIKLYSKAGEDLCRKFDKHSLEHVELNFFKQGDSAYRVDNGKIHALPKGFKLFSAEKMYEANNTLYTLDEDKIIEADEIGYVKNKMFTAKVNGKWNIYKILESEY